MHPHLAARDIRKIMALVKMPPETVISLSPVVFAAAIFLKWLGKGHGKIDCPRPGPPARLTVTRDQRIIHYPHIGPDILVLIIVNAADQIQDNMRLIAGRKSILMNAHAGRRRSLPPPNFVFLLSSLIIIPRLPPT